jgi:Asp-tRNA(Asn)/Glu-tRNA(Gln) amidotransferase A subunit family amidase
MSDIAFKSATELAAAIRAGEIGSLELLDRYLARIAHHNPRINAVITIDADAARKDAGAANDETARCSSRGPAAPTAALPHDQSPDMDARTVDANGALRQGVEVGARAGFVGACYFPATVAPAGLAPAGLPVGVQVVAPYLEDRTAIDLARRLAGVVGGFVAPPGFE